MSRNSFKESQRRFHGRERWHSGRRRVNLARSRLESKDSRYEQIQLIRQYTGFSPFTLEEADKLKAWLILEAEKQFHLVDLVNSAIFHLSEISVELPAFGSLVRLAAEASYEADKKQRELLHVSISASQKEKLDALLQSECQYQRTPFYELKEPPENPNAKTIQKEIQLLQRLRSFNIDFDVLIKINNDKIKHFFEIARSYKSNELYDLNPEIRYPYQPGTPSLEDLRR